MVFPATYYIGGFRLYFCLPYYAKSSPGETHMLLIIPKLDHRVKFILNFDSYGEVVAYFEVKLYI